MLWTVIENAAWNCTVLVDWNCTVLDLNPTPLDYNSKLPSLWSLGDELMSLGVWSLNHVQQRLVTFQCMHGLRGQANGSLALKLC